MYRLGQREGDGAAAAGAFNPAREGYLRDDVFQIDLVILSEHHFAQSADAGVLVDTEHCADIAVAIAFVELVVAGRLLIDDSGTTRSQCPLHCPISE